MTTNSGTYQENPPDDSNYSQKEWDDLSYDMQYYYANKQRQEYLKEKAAEINQRNRDYVKEVKEDGCCQNCGESCPVALDFHHTGEKKNDVATLVNKEYSLDKIKSEIDKCELVCSNCHRKHHAGVIDLNRKI